jgi:chromosome segregation ATPase
LAQSENSKIERQLTIGDDQISQRHKTYENETAELADFSETVETQRHALEKLEADDRFYQGEIEDYRNKAAQENAKMEAFLQRPREAQDALSAQKDQTGSLNQQTNIMNNFLKKEEIQLKALETAIDSEKGLWVIIVEEETFTNSASECAESNGSLQR